MVTTEADGSPYQRIQFVDSDLISPFQGLIIDARRTWSGGVGRSTQSIINFLMSDGDEGSGGGEGVGEVTGEVSWNGSRGRKPCAEKEVGFVGGVRGDRSIRMHEGGGVGLADTAVPGIKPPQVLVVDSGRKSKRITLGAR